MTQRRKILELANARDELLVNANQLQLEHRKENNEKDEIENAFEELKEKYDQDLEIWTERNNQIETELAETAEQLDQVNTKKLQKSEKKLQKISSFDKNFAFRQKLRISKKNRILTKNSHFDKNFAFRQKFRIFTKISHFDKNFEF